MAIFKRPSSRFRPHMGKPGKKWVRPLVRKVGSTMNKRRLSPTPITNALLRTAVHLLLLPMVVGITYEFNRWVGRHVQDSGLAKVLTAPGMWMQNFTTNEPDDSMIEVAIRSLELVLPSEKGKDVW